MTTASLYAGTRTPHFKNYQGTPSKKAVCVYCKGAHTPNHCEVITDSQKCLEVVKREKLCYNCLAHHKVSECRSKHRCNKCKRKHHTNLCDGRENTTEQSDTKNNDTPPTNHAMLSAIHTAVNLQSNASNQGVPKTTTCILKTVIATVSAGGRHTKANILFDEGAQRSFVSQKLSTLLKLHPHNTENIRISGFGAESPSDQLLGTVNIYVQSLPGEQMPASALIVPYIATPLQNSFQACVKNIPHLQGLVLAYPITRGEISLLIGADHY